MIQVPDEPNEREMAFDVWIRKIISNGLNENKPAIIQLERNKAAMKRLYDAVNMTVPERTDQHCYSFFVNGKKYTTNDKRIYSALKTLNKAEQKLAFLLYWENVKDVQIMQQLQLTKKALKDRKREMITQLVKALERIVQ